MDIRRVSGIVTLRLIFVIIVLKAVFYLINGPFDQTNFYNTGVNRSDIFAEVKTEERRGLKVISFSLFDKIEMGKKYKPGILKNYCKMKELYPGWVMWIYTDTDIELHLPGLYFYNTKNLSNLGDVTGMEKMVWRFLPIGDQTVDIFISKDLDSLIGKRERAAVAQWEISNFKNKVFHSMKDHPLHTASVMGGMWGVKNYMLKWNTRQYLLKKFIKNRSNDQKMLAKIFYYQPDFNFKDSFMIHNSYSCKKIQNSIPFPTQRESRTDFVGNYFFERHPINAPECPVACRPYYGKNWTYC